MVFKTSVHCIMYTWVQYLHIAVYFLTINNLDIVMMGHPHALLPPDEIGFLEEKRMSAQYLFSLKKEKKI